jgi:hypothetical protein
MGLLELTRIIRNENHVPTNIYYQDDTATNTVKDRGVPQGAPTSCSLATLAFRPNIEKLNVVIYADDLIYFPDRADADPVKDLSKVK